MSGERDLDKLQRHLAPTLHPATFVYCNFPDFRLPPGLEPICTFREAEGLTAIVEEAAADRLFGLLPTATGRRFRDMWDEYERGDTAEARFVMAIDRLAPMMLNLAEGASTWREYGINRSRVIARNGHHIEKSLPGAWSVVLAQLDAAAAAGHVDPT